MAHNLRRGGAKMHRDVADILRTLSWDDLRVFLACAEQSSFRKAAKLLKINSATIVRRIERLEQVIGYRLFVRHKVVSWRGYAKALSCPGYCRTLLPFDLGLFYLLGCPGGAHR